MYNLPLFYQVIFNLSAGEAGMRLMPYSVGAALGSLGYGYLMAKTVHDPVSDYELMGFRGGIIG